MVKPPKIKILAAVPVVALCVRAVCAQSPVTVAISTQSPGYTIPDDFAGLSFEMGSAVNNRNGYSGYLFSATNSQTVTLFQNVGVRNLRMGGGSVDGTNAVIPTTAGIKNAFEFAQAVGDLKIIYSLRLENGNSASNAATAQFIWQNYSQYLTAFAIGNEPDWNSYHYPPYGSGTDPAITNYTSYLADWRSFAAAITNVAPGARFVGPDTGDYTGSTWYQGESWTQHFADDEKNSGIIADITQHYYVGGSPGSTTGPQAVSNMLSAGWVTTTYPWLYSNNLAPVVADGMPYRMTEANDYLTGIADASNAYASALWALDFMHWWAAHFCAGVNFHNKSWLLTDTIFLDTSGNIQANPKAYGIKMFNLGGHGSVEPLTIIEPLTITNANQLNLTAYTVGTTSNLFVTIINKENGTGARDAAITIMPSGIYSGAVTAMFLTAPGGNIAATNGLTLGGAAITNNEPWQGQWTSLGTLTNGQCAVTVPAASAAVIKIVPAAGLAITNHGNNQLQLNWSQGTLQVATNIAGPFASLSNATPPYTISPTNVQQFFRVKQ